MKQSLFLRHFFGGLLVATGVIITLFALFIDLLAGAFRTSDDTKSIFLSGLAAISLGAEMRSSDAIAQERVVRFIGLFLMVFCGVWLPLIVLSLLSAEPAPDAIKSLVIAVPMLLIGILFYFGRRLFTCQPGKHSHNVSLAVDWSVGGGIGLLISALIGILTHQIESFLWFIPGVLFMIGGLLINQKDKIKFRKSKDQHREALKKLFQEHEEKKNAALMSKKDSNAGPE